MPISSSQIRTQFLEFFRERGHTVAPSSSLVPHGDPTLLLTNAGMVQFKPYFLGEDVPPNRRLASSQKSFRTVDIDCVGDESHLTFFEMLGNFSIGDYFKRGAIAYAWELLTEGWKLPQERLWATVYPTDDESFQLWQELTAIPVARLVRLHENWWGPAGETGPCGPDTEIFLDRGPEHGCGKADCQPGCNCERFLEIWNLVLMQFNRGPDGQDTPLPKPSIDTGAGLERLAMVLNDKGSVYETDLFYPIIERAADLAGIRYGHSPKADFSLRVIADHSRAVAFLIGDGVLPSNEGRGYILRRILRRAVRHGHLLGLHGPFLSKTVGVVVDIMGDTYPELPTRRDFITKVINLEEARFLETLNEGLERLDLLLDDLTRQAPIPCLTGNVRLSGQAAKTVPGGEAFRLYDTYGFPLDITKDRAAERGFVVDEAGFQTAMEAQRQRARAGAKFGLDQWQETYRTLSLPETRFLGYETAQASGKVLSILYRQTGDNLPDAVPQAVAGDAVEVVLDATPFYGEAGGQVGDVGLLVGPQGRVAVSDTQRALGGVIVHIGQVTEGSLSVGEQVTATVDVERRLDIARNHTATHLLHKALRQVLGEHAQQRGSLVAPDRLRFDFTHLTAVTPEELRQIEEKVNAAIRADLPVTVAQTTYGQAIAQGAMALFGEKYGDTVRLVQAGDYSQELCGGTHLQRTGQIGFCLVLSESSVGAGLRRVEAVTGRGAAAYVRQRLTLLDEAASRLQVTPDEVPGKLTLLLDDLAGARKEIERLQREAAKGQVQALLAQVRAVKGVKVLAAQVDATSMEALREMTDWLRDRLGSAVIVLGAVVGERPAFVAVVTPDLVAKGYHAGRIVKEVATITGGSGGGRPELAQAGGKDSSQIAAALARVPGLL
jgi:alanyl-tRNA synthetase